MSRRSVTRSGATISVLTMLSRLLGLARDVLMAGFFGTGLHMSAFVLAFTIPNLFRRLFGEGALSAAFIPIFIEAKNREGAEAAWLLARRVTTIIAAFLALLVALGLIAISIAMNNPGLGDMTNAVLPLLRIMLPYMFFICLAALAMAIINSFQRFAVPAAMPCLLNVIWISAVLFIVPKNAGTPSESIKIVAWAVLVAGLAQLFGQLPTLMKLGYRPGVDLNFRTPKVQRVFILMGPAALGLAVTQINVVIDRLLAAWIGDWAPAALFFSERLIYLPLGVFATAMGTALLPALAEHVSDKDPEGLRKTLTCSTRNILFILIPAAAGLFVLAKPIIQLLFEWREFGAGSTAQSAIALQFYAPGLIFFGLAKMLVPTFYAHQNTSTPVKLSVLTVGLNLVLNITFVLTWPTEIKHAGLALGTVLAEGFYVAALSHSLRRKGMGPDWRSLAKHIAISLISATIMGLAAPALHTAIAGRIVDCGMSAKLGQLITVPTTILVATGIYLLSYILLLKLFINGRN